MKPKLLLALVSIFLVFSCSKKDLPNPKPDTNTNDSIPTPHIAQPTEIKVIGGAIKDAELIDSNKNKANYKGNGVYMFDDLPTGILTLSGGEFEASGVYNRLTYTVDAKYKIISPITHFVTKYPDKREALLNTLNIDENDLSIDFIQNLADNKDTEKAINLAKASQMLYALGIIGLDKNLDLATASDFQAFYKQVEIAAKPNYTKENESTPIYMKGLEELPHFIEAVKDFTADKIPTIETELKIRKLQLPYIGSKGITDKGALKQAISYDYYLGLLNTSAIKDMTILFRHNKNPNEFFDGIEYWDVSNVTNMSNMFQDASSFNQPLNNWNVAKVENMSWMFYDAISFNQALNNWDVANVKNMYYMFRLASSFNQALNKWNVANVEKMGAMFYDASSFNQALNNWDVANVKDMSQMFYGAISFNQPLNNWNVAKVENMSRMFFSASNFNQPLNNWDVAKVEDMEAMFYHAISFNQPLNNWNVANVKEMSRMFSGASSFNQDLSGWNVSTGTKSEYMFADSAMADKKDKHPTFK